MNQPQQFQLPDNATIDKEWATRDAERRSTLGAMGYDVIDQPGGAPKIVKKPTLTEQITDSAAWATKGYTQDASGAWIKNDDTTTDTNTKFQSAAEKMMGDLKTGVRDWGNAFNYMYSQFGQEGMTPEQDAKLKQYIDLALNKNQWAKPNAYNDYKTNAPEGELNISADQSANGEQPQPASKESWWKKLFK